LIATSARRNGYGETLGGGGGGGGGGGHLCLLWRSDSIRIGGDAWGLKILKIDAGGGGGGGGGVSTPRGVGEKPRRRGGLFERGPAYGGGGGGGGGGWAAEDGEAHGGLSAGGGHTADGLEGEAADAAAVDLGHDVAYLRRHGAGWQRGVFSARFRGEYGGVNACGSLVDDSMPLFGRRAELIDIFWRHSLTKRSLLWVIIYSIDGSRNLSERIHRIFEIFSITWKPDQVN
jgi:hypothetical protein